MKLLIVVIVFGVHDVISSSSHRHSKLLEATRALLGYKKTSLTKDHYLEVTLEDEATDSISVYIKKNQRDKSTVIMEENEGSISIHVKKKDINLTVFEPKASSHPDSSINKILGSSKENKKKSSYSEAVESNIRISGGADNDPTIRQKRDFIKGMMKHAWDNYVRYAWGKNELKPILKRGHSQSVFGPYDTGATIVDSLDTLLIMEMYEEFGQGREWVKNHLNISDIETDVLVFEVSIRYLGGLLSTYALTGDLLFKSKAVDIAEKLLPAFNTPKGVPRRWINMQSGSSKGQGTSILSEFGTLHMEFSYLSDITGNITYKEKVEKLREHIRKEPKRSKLYPNTMNENNGKWMNSDRGLGGLSDSFYEYLLKEWIRSNQNDEVSRQMFDDALDGIESELLRTTSSGQIFVGEIRNGTFLGTMPHLACFAGGMYGLAANSEKNSSIAKKQMKIAEGLTRTCYLSYDTPTGLGPEGFGFNGQKPQERYYILRPETIESIFVLWRITNDNKYREWGWKLAQAIEKNCRVDGGYSGLMDVNYIKSYDDIQQSFFLAETLKYLYLLFSDNSLIDMTYWVFNTEAHPLPIKYVNPMYRSSRN